MWSPIWQLVSQPIIFKSWSEYRHLAYFLLSVILQFFARFAWVYHVCTGDDMDTDLAHNNLPRFLLCIFRIGNFIPDVWSYTKIEVFLRKITFWNFKMLIVCSYPIRDTIFCYRCSHMFDIGHNNGNIHFHKYNNSYVFYSPIMDSLDNVLQFPVKTFLLKINQKLKSSWRNKIY